MHELSHRLRARFNIGPKVDPSEVVPRLEVEAAKDILVDVEEGGVASITLNRPAKRNAVSLAMWRRLAELVGELAERETVRVLILTGAGGHFCAGADISEFATLRADVTSGRIYEAANEAATA